MAIEVIMIHIVHKIRSIKNEDVGFLHWIQDVTDRKITKLYQACWVKEPEVS